MDHRHLRFACIASVSLSAAPALADDPPAPPAAVAVDAGGKTQEGKTEAVDVPKEAKARPEGWTPGIAIGATFNVNDSRAVVGQQDGTSVTIGAGIDASLEFNHGMHEWRNGLLASAGVTRTPAINEFIKTNDGLAFESIYLLHVIEMFGPFARFGLNTQMFGGTDVRPATVDYVVANLDGSESTFRGRRLGLTDPFVPLTLRESLGVFIQPIRETQIELEARAGLGALETIAAGNLAVADDDTTAVVEVKELDDSFQIGAEAIVNAWGFFDETKRVSYTVGAGVLVPFVTSELPAGDDRGLGELTTVEGMVGLNVKLFDWASLGYKLTVSRQPMLVDEWQVQNNLLLTIGAAFGSKAPVPEPPKCDCPKDAPAAPEPASADPATAEDPAAAPAPAPAAAEPAPPPPAAATPTNP